MRKLESLAEGTLADVWYPFTQHAGLRAEDVTVIDARYSEEMLVFKPGSGQEQHARIEAQYDACASWWTQVRSNLLNLHAWEAEDSVQYVIGCIELVISLNMK